MSTSLYAVRHPRLGELYDLWNLARGTRAMPIRRDLDVLALKPWLGHLTLVDVLRPPLDFRYRVYGTTLRNYYGRDLQGRKVSELPAAWREEVHAEYAAVCEAAAPVMIEQNRTTSGGPLQLAKLMLPLAGDNGGTEMILSGIYAIAVARK